MESRVVYENDCTNLPTAKHSRDLPDAIPGEHSSLEEMYQTVKESELESSQKHESAGAEVGITAGNWEKLSTLESEFRALEYRLTPSSCEASLVYGKQTLRSGKEIFCDGKWTVFQKRFNGSVDFDRLWTDYRNGFGSLDGEFWYGLENIHLLTNERGCRVRFDLWDFEGDHAFAEYSGFSVEDESDNYRLHIAGYSGTAGDGLLTNHSVDGIQFSTMDRDNDMRNEFNCAQERGGFWHNACALVHPNNVWTPNQTTELRYILWIKSTPLKETVIKMRCD